MGIEDTRQNLSSFMDILRGDFFILARLGKDMVGAAAYERLDGIMKLRLIQSILSATAVDEPIFHGVKDLAPYDGDIDYCEVLR